MPIYQLKIFAVFCAVAHKAGLGVLVILLRVNYTSSNGDGEKQATAAKNKKRF
jgi:hypothetical protein